MAAAAADTEDGVMVKVQSMDSKVFEIPSQVAKMSVTLKNLIEDLGENVDTPIPLQNISAAILTKVIDYCTHHKDDEPPAADENAAISDKRLEPVTGWDLDFCKVDQATLFEMILAANYLDIKPMLDLTCKTVAEMIRGKTPEEIRKHFNIKNDFTPEEEEQVRRENEWCEEA
eukprot:m.56506 g.56506  ORF g.56506 m.56506 type:complete len:173 (+) comp16978_c0_seq1:97-615(+)